jgi:hypothetical protein
MVRVKPSIPAVTYLLHLFAAPNTGCRYRHLQILSMDRLPTRASVCGDGHSLHFFTAPNTRC